jgi:hypothetical protein
MDHTDLETAAIRGQQEESKYKDIYAGEVRAGSEILLFERAGLYEDRFSVMLPKSFVDLPKALAKLKYPAENRPSVIKTNDDTTVNFAFSFYKRDFSEAQVESALKSLKAGVGKLTPGARFFETRILQTEDGVKFGYFDFLTAAIDTELYQLFGFIPVDGKFLHIIFNAPANMMRTWRPVAVQVLQSVRGIGNDGGESA